MNVKQLIELLQQEDPDRIVICQKNVEGNKYSPLSNIRTGYYLANTTCSGTAGLEKLSEQNIQDGYSEEDVIAGNPALVLVPVN